jgi:hypothetical protein
MDKFFLEAMSQCALNRIQESMPQPLKSELDKRVEHGLTRALSLFVTPDWLATGCPQCSPPANRYRRAEDLYRGFGNR